MKLGSLQRVPLREVWKNEERDLGFLEVACHDGYVTSV